MVISFITFPRLGLVRLTLEVPFAPVAGGPGREACSQSVRSHHITMCRTVAGEGYSCLCGGDFTASHLTWSKEGLGRFAAGCAVSFRVTAGDPRRGDE